MVEQPAPSIERQPQVGDVVLYRRLKPIMGVVDLAAIVTALVADGEHECAVHLHQFAPPGQGAELIDYRWGAAHGFEPGEWHYRDEVTS